MGCDFYTFYVIHIQYRKDGEVDTISEEIEDSRTRHYFDYWGERDEDIEELSAYHERCKEQRAQQIADALRLYVVKDIYKDGHWLCIATAKEKYLNLCKE